MQFRSVPSNRRFRRQDGPMHCGKTVAEKPGGFPQDMMFGFKPRDIMLTDFRLHFSETHEGSHLMQVTPDLFLHTCETMHDGVGGVAQQGALAVRNAPGTGVEKRETFGIAMANDFLCQQLKSCWQHQRNFRHWRRNTKQ